jgi:hypothetical protein
LLLAVALATSAAGCRLLDRVIHHGHGGDDLGDAPTARAHALDRRALLTTRDRLRDSREHAWARLADGGHADGFGKGDALALSAVEREIDVRMAASRRAPEAAAGIALPRVAWWYLFVEPAAWARGPLAIDHERAPGTYAAMTAAYERVFARRDGGAALPIDQVLIELHRLAARGVFDASGAPHQARASQGPVQRPLIALHDLAALHADHLRRALEELKAEGVAGWNAEVQAARSDDAPPPWLARELGQIADINPHTKPVTLVYDRAHSATGDDFGEWLVALTDYEPDEARRWAAQWFADYAAARAQLTVRSPAEYAELLTSAQPGADLVAALRPIAQLVRRLRVAQLFNHRCDSGEAALMLNTLLVAAGLPPTILDDPTIFDGREPLDELVAAIAAGERRYQALAAELAARTPPAEDRPPMRPELPAPMMPAPAMPAMPAPAMPAPAMPAPANPGW